MKGQQVSMRALAENLKRREAARVFGVGDRTIRPRRLPGDRRERVIVHGPPP